MPSSILTKPGKLSDIEFELIKELPKNSYDLIKDIHLGKHISSIVFQHHEREDGSGYPLGLKSNEILFFSKIVAVADVIEAMSSFRPYRPALGYEKALEEIVRNKKKLYEPAIVEACIALFKKDSFSF